MYRLPRSNEIIWAFLLCLFILHGPVAVFAVSPVSATQWQRLTDDKAFGYRNDHEVAARPKQIESTQLQQFFAQLFSFFGNGAGRILLWCAVIAAVIFIVYKMLFSKDSILFGRSSKSLKAKATTVQDEEDIATTDWETLLHDAMQRNDTRQVIRYSYMRLLQLLQNRGLISVGNEKTNYEYYNELGESVFRQPFRQLSRRYEYVWYGQYPVSVQDYNSYISLFNDLKKQLDK